MAEVGSLSFLGVSSGIDFNEIINQLTIFKQQQLANIDQDITEQTTKKTSLEALQALVLSIQSKAISVGLPSTFKQTTSTSSNESILKVSGNQVTTLGSFQVTVDKIAAAHQVISEVGYASKDTTFAAASGAITIEVGGGFIDRKTPISSLKGQQGIEKGSIKITDKAGNSAIIDFTAALTVKDILDKINNATGISVKAEVQSDRLLLTDTSGGSGSFQIQDVGSTLFAQNLGINQSTTGTEIYSSDVNFVTSSTKLTALNDFLGVRRNSNSITDFTITDTDGTSFNVDISSTVSTVGLVISTINSAAITAGSSLRARLNEDRSRLILSDATGGQSITVSAAGTSGIAAVDLGFGVASGTNFVQFSAETIGSTNQLVGGRLIPTLTSSFRNLLNGGQNFVSGDSAKGVGDGTIFLQDKDNDSVTINISKRFSTAGSAISTTSVTVLSTDGIAVGNKIRIVDAANAQHYKTVTRVSGTTIFFDNPLASGAGLVTVHATLENINDMINVLNQKASSSSVNVKVSLNPLGNGFMVKETGTGASANLKVSGTVVNDLGIKGDTSNAKIVGSDLDIQYISHDTLLSNLNSGGGVEAGKIQIQDTTGITFTVDLSQSDDTTVGKVITDINGASIAAGSALRARINDTGDGIILEDTAGGTGAIKVTESGGTTTAADLNLLGTADSSNLGKLDGSFEKSISIDAGSSLEDIIAEINSSSIPVFAQIINTGDDLTPYRVNIISTKTGEAGRLVIDSDIPNFEFQTSAEAQDAVVVVGSNVGSSNPILVTKDQNQITDVIPGLTIDLISASSNAVTITVNRNTAAAADAVSGLVEEVNSLQKQINSDTAFDSETNVKGPLFANGTARIIKQLMLGQVTNSISGIPASNLNIPQELGIEVQNDGLVSFDAGKFTTELTNNPDEVIEFFTKQKKIEGTTSLTALRSGLGIDALEGKDDFKIILRDAGLTLTVNLDPDDSVQTMLNKVNLASTDQGTANGGKITMGIDSGGFKFELVDNSVTTKTIDSGNSSGAGTFVDAELINRDGDQVVGATVKFITGANAGTTGTVTAYVSATGAITINQAINISAGETYQITTKLGVEEVNSSPAASQLGIKKTTDDGDVVLKGDAVNLAGDPGFTHTLNALVNTIMDDPGGVLTSAIDNIDDIIDRLEADKEDVEEQIKKQEEQLILEFTQLELVLAKSQTTQAQLSSLLGSIQSISGVPTSTFRF